VILDCEESGVLKLKFIQMRTDSLRGELKVANRCPISFKTTVPMKIESGSPVILNPVMIYYSESLRGTACAFKEAWESEDSSTSVRGYITVVYNEKLPFMSQNVQQFEFINKRVKIIGIDVIRPFF
jgi:hypothetical protein